MAGRPAVFLDRDGVLVREVGFITRPDEARILPGAAEGMAALREAGYAVVVVTNQSGIARGLLTESGLAAIHEDLARRLRQAHPGAVWDALYYCPHHPDAGAPPHRTACGCRKPAPGMLLRAAAERGLDLASSWMVGDAGRDLEAGRAAGCRTVALPDAAGGFPPGADLSAASLAEAALRLTRLPRR